MSYICACCFCTIFCCLPITILTYTIRDQQNRRRIDNERIIMHILNDRIRTEGEEEGMTTIPVRQKML